MPALPRDLFFIMRVITLLRGVLASMQCLTVSSALLWEPIARKVTTRRAPAGLRPRDAFLALHPLIP